MTTFHIQRNHTLGLARARHLARHWAEAAEQKHQMACTVTEEQTGERVDFVRPGVRGELVASADGFALTVTLGFLLAAFSPRIRDEIEKNLDAAIANAAAQPGDDTC
ncbi:MAG: polyhydroxyalkanoic acid system family protein [Pseudomonadota bacterium]|nr:polyhydroxyalkanoic acid system family protein [Pseudomonadota bacterium]